jgi:hypothetical protein
MAVDFADTPEPGLEFVDRDLGDVRLRLIEPWEQERFNTLLATEHYLRNPTVVGRVLRYVAEYRGEWVALLVFASAAFHLKPRESWLEWTPRQLEQRRHLIAQNTRFLILGSKRSWQNLASYLLGQACARLSNDWQRAFGCPVLLVETFVDPQRFQGTCYRAAGFVRLGPTKGYSRVWRDFYDDTQQPKELFVRPLSPRALRQLRAAQLPPSLAEHERPLPPPCPVATEHLGSLREAFQHYLTDPRCRRGVRHPLVSILTVIALGVCAGCQNPHAIAAFAENLNHGQRRLLRCRRRTGTLHQYEVPGERTIRRLLKQIDPEELKEALVQWMASVDGGSPTLLHVDGKVVKNADPAPPQRSSEAPTSPNPVDLEIPPELQKPKADKALTLVHVMTTDQRLVDQLVVPADTNEEATFAAALPSLDLAGTVLTADAAHAVKANFRQIVQGNGGDFFTFLKANQPNAFAKAKQLLSSAIPPSGCLPEQGTRPPGGA